MLFWFYSFLKILMLLTPNNIFVLYLLFGLSDI